MVKCFIGKLNLNLWFEFLKYEYLYILNYVWGLWSKFEFKFKIVNCVNI